MTDPVLVPDPVSPDSTVTVTGVPADAPMPSSKTPVVLSTASPLEVFVLPGEKDGDDLTVTYAGVAVSRSDAKRALEAARHCGVALVDTDTTAEKG